MSQFYRINEDGSVIDLADFKYSEDCLEVEDGTFVVCPDGAIRRSDATYKMLVYGLVGTNQFMTIADDNAKGIAALSSDYVLMKKARPTEDHYATANGSWSLNKEHLATRYHDAIQKFLSDTATEKGYSVDSISSYKDSTVEQFKNEATAFLTWRDSIWAKFLADKAANLLTPTPEEYVATLERLVW